MYTVQGELLLCMNVVLLVQVIRYKTAAETAEQSEENLKARDSIFTKFECKGLQERRMEFIKKEKKRELK